MSYRSLWMLLALLFAVAVPSSVYARANGDRVQVGRSIVVEEDEEAGDLVCIGCSIHMMGTCGDVVTIGGSITIDGTVKGDAVTVGRNAYWRERFYLRRRSYGRRPAMASSQRNHPRRGHHAISPYCFPRAVPCAVDSCGSHRSPDCLAGETQATSSSQGLSNPG